jgi:hypothetical protein
MEIEGSSVSQQCQVLNVYSSIHMITICLFKIQFYTFHLRVVPLHEVFY